MNLCRKYVQNKSDLKFNYEKENKRKHNETYLEECWDRDEGRTLVHYSKRCDDENGDD